MAINGNVYTEYDDAGLAVRATSTVAVAAGASTTVIKGTPGRVVSVQMTAEGTSADNATIYDNASAGSGTILAVIPGGVNAAGVRLPVDLPAKNGITVVNVASGPAFTLGYS